MPKILAYIRTSTDKQDLGNQKLALLEFARLQGITIDDFLEVTASTRHPRKDRRIDELVSQLEAGDTLLVTELSRLGRSSAEVVTLVNTLIQSHIRVIVLKQNLNMSLDSHDLHTKMSLTLFSLFGELERDLISLRTKEALAAKKRSGQILGKPKGTIQNSKFDKDREKIKELLGYGLSIRKIATVLGYTNAIALGTYIKKRHIKTGTPQKGNLGD